jgi:hypothetical protein
MHHDSATSAGGPPSKGLTAHVLDKLFDWGFNADQLAKLLSRRGCFVASQQVLDWRGGETFLLDSEYSTSIETIGWFFLKALEANGGNPAVALEIFWRRLPIGSCMTPAALVMAAEWDALRLLANPDFLTGPQAQSALQVREAQTPRYFSIHFETVAVWASF